MTRAQSPSVTSHADLVSHPKLIALCDRLSIRRTEGVGLLHLLWHWACENAPDDGCLFCSHSTLADAIYWPGDAELLIEALVAEGWVDKVPDGKLYIHEWAIYRQDYTVITKKRERDRERLRRLRQQEQMALLPPEPVTVPEEFTPGKELPEAMRIHIVLMGDDTSALPNDLRRIERTLEVYPKIEAYDVALNYMAWQIDVAKAYRLHARGEKPHTDTIKGWQNQVRMHAKRGWSLKGRKDSRSPMLTISAADVLKYHTNNVKSA